MLGEVECLVVEEAELEVEAVEYLVEVEAVEVEYLVVVAVELEVVEELEEVYSVVAHQEEEEEISPT